MTHDAGGLAVYKKFRSYQKATEGSLQLRNPDREASGPHEVIYMKDVLVILSGGDNGERLRL